MKSLLASLLLLEAFALPPCPKLQQTALFGAAEKYRQHLIAIHKTEPPFEGGGRWSCPSGGCTTFPSIILKALKKRNEEGMRLVRQQVPSGDIGPLLHEFLEETPEVAGVDPIIVDPTYLQFFKNGDSLGEPETFIGTRAELVAIFEKHKAHWKNYGPEVTAEEFVAHRWGAGEFARYRRFP